MSGLSRHKGVRAPFLSLLAALFALTMLPSATEEAAASCAGPYLEGAGSLVLERGSNTVIEGRSFSEGCQDSMSCPAFGCGSCEYDEPPSTPMQDVSLRLVQGDRTWRLGTADAETAESNRLGSVTWKVRVPTTVNPGRAKLVADSAEPVVVRVR